MHFGRFNLRKLESAKKPQKWSRFSLENRGRGGQIERKIGQRERKQAPSKKGRAERANESEQCEHASEGTSESDEIAKVENLE